MEGPFPVPQQGKAELGLQGEGSAECCLCGGLLGEEPEGLLLGIPAWVTRASPPEGPIQGRGLACVSTCWWD